VYDLHEKSLVLFTAGTKANDEDVLKINDLSESILNNTIGE
jgi:peptide chain release factor 3